MDVMGMIVPDWVFLTIIGVAISAMMGFGGVILVRVGFSPLWIFLLLVPVVQIVAIWAFAYSRWPRIEDPDGWAEKRRQLPVAYRHKG